MNFRSTWRVLVGCVAFAMSGCAPVEDGDDLDATGDEIVSSGAWYHLDRNDGLNNATLTVANGYTVRCPNGTTSTTCRVASLVLPPDCNWECRDGLLGHQGEAMLRGRFDGNRFIVAAGHDSWRAGLGTQSIYRITGSTTCAHDPCPSGLTAQKINTTRAATAITGVDFSHADDTNYVIDRFRADGQIDSPEGLLVSGRIVSHVFRADRVWRLETPRLACDPQTTARNYVQPGSAAEVLQFRTMNEAMRFVIPDSTNTWVVRTAQSPTAVEYTWGINDLWAVRFSIARSTCAITVLAEH